MSMYPIQTYTMSAGQTNFVDFTNIPQQYEHLQIRYMTRDLENLTTRGMFLEVNLGGSWPGGKQHRVTTAGNGTSVGVDVRSVTNRFDWADIPGNSETANVFAAGIIDISSYSSSTKTKTMQVKNGYVNGSGTGMLYMQAMIWDSTAPITWLRIYSNNGYVNGSTLTLYGLSGQEI
jgi:hypothetical protein